jgi:hypothetical protein
VIQGLEIESLDTSMAQYNKPCTVIVDNTNDCLPSQFKESVAQDMESALLEMEQINAPVTHRFAPNIYIREVALPAGAFVMGHYHKTRHLNIMLKGKIKFLGSDGVWVEMSAPQTFVSDEGRKVAFVYEDTIWQNVFSTDETDTDKLEDMYLRKSTTWDEYKNANDKMLELDNVDDISDYYKAIAEFGFTHERVQELTNDTKDQIPFPYGSYNVTISDSKIEGKGMFATAPFKKNDQIAVARVGDNRTPAGRYVNHAKNPNSFYKIEGNDIYLVAGCDIQGCVGGSLGDELTVDYRQALSLEASCRE